MALSSLLLAAAALAGADGEMRGLWVVRTALVSPEAVDRVVDQAQEAGFNALFVQVRGRGDAFYDSRVVSRSVLLERQPRQFDPLQRLLDRARPKGLQVHAWINVLLTAHFSQPLARDHVLVQHPEWVMVPRRISRAALRAKPKDLLGLVYRGSRGDADVEGYYLSPSAPGVSEHLEEVTRELLQRYPVDGLHLDFIRYPNSEYDYSRPALAAFAKRRGTADLIGAPAGDPAGWEDYRRDVLTALAAQLARAARAERPRIVVSAAVVPDEVAALQYKYQAWPTWVASGILDALCPMTYTPEARTFRRQVEQARALIGPGRPLWAGVGAYRLLAGEVIDRIRNARDAGASGVVLFSHESLSPEGLRRLRQEVFAPPPASDAVAGGQGPR